MKRTRPETPPSPEDGSYTSFNPTDRPMLVIGLTMAGIAVLAGYYGLDALAIVLGFFSFGTILNSDPYQ